MSTLRDRFLDKIVALDAEQGECWEWLGHRRRGYGVLHSHGWGSGQVMVLAHRVSYELFVGPIPEGLVVRHACDHPGCVNPDHLSVGTALDNVRDCIQRGRRPRGEALSFCVLSEVESQVLLARYRSGERIADLAPEFGVSERTAHRIRRGTRWKGNA